MIGRSIKRIMLGFVIGMAVGNLIAAMFSIEMTGSMHSSIPTLLKRRMVRGTNMMSDTSLVTNIDVKNTPKPSQLCFNPFFSDLRCLCHDCTIPWMDHLFSAGYCGHGVLHGNSLSDRIFDHACEVQKSCP